MDEYYAQITREVLSEARGKFILVQDYLLRANAPEPYQRQARHLVKQCESLQERILLNTDVPE